MDVAMEIDPATGLLAYGEVVLVMGRQNGKALDSITPVMTTRGWVPMSQVSVGDHVFHPDGHPIAVMFVSDEMTGHECYRVTTVDGRTLVADADHRWTVLDRATSRGAGGTWMTVTTERLRSMIDETGPGTGRYRYRFLLPTQRAIKSADIDLPIDPYVLGMWLGDGTSANASMTVGSDDLDHVRTEIARAGYRVVSAKRDARATAWAIWIGLPRSPRVCDICGGPFLSRGLCKSHYRKAALAGDLPAKVGLPGSVHRALHTLGVIRNKHVPDIYLYAGHDQRLALLQGLMDTDGFIDHRQGRVEFTSTRRTLCDAVLFLARSLGWRATIKEGVAKIDGRTIGPKWRVGWTPTTDEPPPFRMARKAARIRPRWNHSTTGLSAVAIARIDPVPSRPVRCIKVDSPDGLFLAGRDLVATHNTETLLPLMTHRCLGFGPMQRVTYTAQTADSAREKWRDIHLGRLRKSPLSALVDARLRLNAEAMAFPNGSLWFPSSTTGKTSGTGDTLDLAVIDEAWSRPNARTELGLRPAMLTRPSRQLWIASMVPGLVKALPHEWPYLRSKMVAGRSRVDAGINTGTAYFEWSADDQLDPADPATWWSCMPALGQTITEKAVREDFDSTDLVDFCAEYLGWEPQVAARQWQAIRRGAWDAMWDPGSTPLDPVALTIETNPERSVSWIGSAARREDGDWHLELIDQRPGVDWTSERAVELCERWRPCGLVVDPNGPAASLVTGQAPLTMALAAAGLDVPVWRPNLREVAGACAGLFDAIGRAGDPDPDDPAGSRRAHHIGQAELTASAASARCRTVGSQWVWDRQVPTCGPLYTVSLALAAGERVDWAGGDYDIASSLG